MRNMALFPNIIFLPVFKKAYKNENYDESTKIYVVLVLDPLIGKIHNKFW